MAIDLAPLGCWTLRDEAAQRRSAIRYGENMKLTSILALVLGVAILSACSTTPVNESTAKQVPAERIYVKGLIAVGSDPKKARVSFFRDSGYLGSGCSHDLFVDNIKIFSIRQGEYIHLAIEPGPHFFRLETGGGLCPNIATSQNSNIHEGGRETYRILIPSDGNLRLTRVE